MSLIKQLSSILALFNLASALPTHIKRAVQPGVSGTPQVLGVVSDHTLNRDSCTSVHAGDRELWTCRDTESYPNKPFFFFSSSASWTDFNSDGTPEVENGVLRMYGDNHEKAYFSIQPDECLSGGQGGSCSDGTRYAIWPDSRPLPVRKGDGDVCLYSWIKKSHITSNLTSLTPYPAATLYRSTYAPSQSHDELPPVTVVAEEFWPADSIIYGDYGWVIHDGIAYLYGALADSAGIALAKVPEDNIEDKSSYCYYTGSSWSKTALSLDDSSVAIPNAGTGGQGTYYYSEHFSSFIWIGGPGVGVGAEFYVASAPKPEGPWTEPTLFYTGEDGSGEFGAYSQQAHPGLSANRGNGKDIYLTYTKVDSTYSTPLIRVEWQ